ncbi:tyrosine-type recombinase/integrase [Patescibacteria group bacterium]|nr:tyrosine-type recombinase/integrase [Patescibacteria group bacterium]
MEISEKPLTAHIDEFLQYIEIERGLSQSTQVNYRRSLYHLKQWLCSQNKEHAKPHELTTEDIWQYRLYLSRKQDRVGNTVSKKTQNYHLIVLRCLLDYFTLRDITAISSRKIMLSKINDDKQILKFLDTSQIKLLLETPDISRSKGLRDRAIFETLFSTGLRISELVALNRTQFNGIWDQNDFKVSIIGKGNYPRMVFFSERATYWIKEYLKDDSNTYEALFVSYKDSTNKENRLTARSIERLMKIYVLKAGIPTFASPHTIRHSMATNLMEQGVDLRSIQEFLGHRSIVTTQIYTHVTNKRLHDIHKKFHDGNNF